MSNFKILEVRALEPQDVSMAYVGRAASFKWPGVEVIVVAPNDVALKRACQKFGEPVDLLLAQKVAVVSADVLPVHEDDGLGSGL